MPQSELMDFLHIIGKGETKHANSREGYTLLGKRVAAFIKELVD